MTDKFDVLIPLGSGSRHDNLELRYCLRSIEKHLKNVRNVWIVGSQIPDWIKGCWLVAAKESTNNWNRARNIYRKVQYACQKPDLSDTFLYVHDDHFLLKDFDAGSFPYYHDGKIDLNNYLRNEPAYRQAHNTVAVLGTDIFNFDIHCPVNFDKELFKILFKPLGVDWPEYGYCIKSYYCNQLSDMDLVSSRVGDLKFREPAMKSVIQTILEHRISIDAAWFSIGDRCLRSGGMKEVLQELYPNKSKYEIDEVWHGKPIHNNNEI